MIEPQGGIHQKIKYILLRKNDSRTDCDSYFVLKKSCGRIKKKKKKMFVFGEQKVRRQHHMLFLTPAGNIVLQCSNMTMNAHRVGQCADMNLKSTSSLSSVIVHTQKTVAETARGEKRDVELLQNSLFLWEKEISFSGMVRLET